MKRQQFPLVALTLAVPLLGVLWIGGQGADATGSSPVLPLLALLAISELGLLANVGGFVLGIQAGRHQGWTGRHVLITIGCGFAAVAFLLQLIRWWPL
jgi:hypothetical protein